MLTGIPIRASMEVLPDPRQLLPWDYFRVARYTGVTAIDSLERRPHLTRWTDGLRSRAAILCEAFCSHPPN
jgi:hypothetical protein